MAKEPWIRWTGWRRLALALAGASIAAAGCGGEERLSRAEFKDRLGSIERRESARFERLAQRAARVEEDQPLPDDLKQAMTELAEGNRRAADELDRLNPPEDARAATDELIKALRERAEGFGQAARKQRTTLHELEQDGSITRAGEAIDRARERLRKQGFSPEESDHSQPKLASARAVGRDPYAIACGHVQDQQRWADVTRRAAVAIADRERFPKLNRLVATQSLFFAMTELCKRRPASYQPAKAAVRGVQDGRFVADLGAP